MKHAMVFSMKEPHGCCRDSSLKFGNRDKIFQDAKHVLIIVADKDNLHMLLSIENEDESDSLGTFI